MTIQQSAASEIVTLLQPLKGLITEQCIVLQPLQGPITEHILKFSRQYAQHLKLWF